MAQQQYTQNTEVVKAFFRRPIVLITAIVSFATIVANFIVSLNPVISKFFSERFMDEFLRLAQELGVDAERAGIMPGGTMDSASYDLKVLPILFAVAVLLFYIFSRNPERSLKTPATMYKVLSIIDFVLSCILAVTLLLLVLVTVMLSTVRGFEFVLAFTPALIIGAVYIVLFGLSRMLFAGSIKKSTVTIFLYKRGAMLYGIMNFIAAAISAGGSVALLIMGASNAFNSAETLYSMAAFSLIGLPLNILTGIVAVQYASYIKKYAEKFTSQAEENGYYEGTAPAQKLCPGCGKPMNDDDYFCNFCGTPVNKDE